MTQAMTIHRATERIRRANDESFAAPGFRPSEYSELRAIRSLLETQGALLIEIAELLRRGRKR